MQAHLIECAGTRIDASNPSQRAVLHRIADRLAADHRWAQWRTVAAVIEAGEAREKVRQDVYTAFVLDLDDDPGKRGTHSRPEAFDVMGRVMNVRRPWQRQGAKGNKAHVERKKAHAVRTIETRAMKLVWGYG